MPPKEDKNKPNTFPDQLLTKILGKVYAYGASDKVLALYMLLDTLRLDQLPRGVAEELLSGELYFARESQGKDRREGGTEGVHIWKGEQWGGKIGAYRIVGEKGKGGRVLFCKVEAPQCPQIFAFCKFVSEHDRQMKVAESIDTDDIQEVVTSLVKLAGGGMRCYSLIGMQQTPCQETPSFPVNMEQVIGEVIKTYSPYISNLMDLLSQKESLLRYLCQDPTKALQRFDNIMVPTQPSLRKSLEKPGDTEYQKVAALMKSCDALSENLLRTLPEFVHLMETVRAHLNAILSQKPIVLKQSVAQPISTGQAISKPPEKAKEKLPASKLPIEDSLSPEEIAQNELARTLNVLLGPLRAASIENFKKVAAQWEKVGKLSIGEDLQKLAEGVHRTAETAPLIDSFKFSSLRKQTLRNEPYLGTLTKQKQLFIEKVISDLKLGQKLVGAIKLNPTENMADQVKDVMKIISSCGVWRDPTLIDSMLKHGLFRTIEGRLKISIKSGCDHEKWLEGFKAMRKETPMPIEAVPMIGLENFKESEHGGVFFFGENPTDSQAGYYLEQVEKQLQERKDSAQQSLISTIPGIIHGILGGSINDKGAIEYMLRYKKALPDVELPKIHEILEARKYFDANGEYHPMRMLTGLRAELDSWLSRIKSTVVIVYSGPYSALENKEGLAQSVKNVIQCGYIAALPITNNFRTWSALFLHKCNAGLSVRYYDPEENEMPERFKDTIQNCVALEDPPVTVEFHEMHNVAKSLGHTSGEHVVSFLLRLARIIQRGYTDIEELMQAPPPLTADASATLFGTFSAGFGSPHNPSASMQPLSKGTVALQEDEKLPLVPQERLEQFIHFLKNSFLQNYSSQAQCNLDLKLIINVELQTKEQVKCMISIFNGFEKEDGNIHTLLINEQNLHVQNALSLNMSEGLAYVSKFMFDGDYFPLLIDPNLLEAEFPNSDLHFPTPKSLSCYASSSSLQVSSSEEEPTSDGVIKACTLESVLKAELDKYLPPQQSASSSSSSSSKWVNPLHTAAKASATHSAAPADASPCNAWDTLSSLLNDLLLNAAKRTQFDNFIKLLMTQSQLQKEMPVAETMNTMAMHQLQTQIAPFLHVATLPIHVPDGLGTTVGPEAHEASFEEIAAMLNSSTLGQVFYYNLHLSSDYTHGPDHYVHLHAQNTPQGISVLVVDSLPDDPHHHSHETIQDVVAEHLHLSSNMVQVISPVGGIQENVGVDTCGMISLAFALGTYWYDHHPEAQGVTLLEWLDSEHDNLAQDAYVIMQHVQNPVPGINLNDFLTHPYIPFLSSSSAQQPSVAEATEHTAVPVVPSAHSLCSSVSPPLPTFGLSVSEPAMPTGILEFLNTFN